MTTKIRKLSPKRAKQNREYRQKAALYLSVHPVCEACKQNEATQIHHKKGRIGELLTDMKYFLAVCESCHRFIELHPVQAKKYGFSLSRLAV